MARKIVEEIPIEVIQADLEILRKKALEWGATDAKIITADKVLIDERVRAKCSNPKCPLYGTNGSCPPHAPDLDMVRETVKRYRYGVFIITKYLREEFTGSHYDSLINRDKLHNYKLVAQIEAEAFHSGYYLAMGFADGSCKTRLCPDQECSVLAGKGCRMGLKARSSMESWGMNAYMMATRAGWEVYPIGAHTRTEDVPYRVTLGLVLVC